MKVLIYEPGTEGHRSVYLRYVVEAFTEANCKCLSITESYLSRPLALTKRAVDEGVSVIFVCTLDGLFGWLTILGLSCSMRNIEVAGIYYLFNNLHYGWKRYLWRALIRAKLLSRVFTPDLALDHRNLNGFRDAIVFIADPWDQRYLYAMDRKQAMQECGVVDHNSCVFLLFGEISERKGLHLILSALENWDYELRPKIRLLAVGRISRTVQLMLDKVLQSNLRLKDTIIFENRWVGESEHSRYFASAAYLCALYPKYFKVSISTVLRSFAVMRPVVVGDHGMIGEVVKRDGSGFVCDTASHEGVKSTLERAYDTYMFGCGEEYLAMAKAGQHIAKASELAQFKVILHRWISERRIIASRMFP